MWNNKNNENEIKKRNNQHACTLRNPRCGICSLCEARNMCVLGRGFVNM